MLHSRIKLEKTKKRTCECWVLWELRSIFIFLPLKEPYPEVHNASKTTEHWSLIHFQQNKIKLKRTISSAAQKIYKSENCLKTKIKVKTLMSSPESNCRLATQFYYSKHHKINQSRRHIIKFLSSQTKKYWAELNIRNQKHD